MKIPPEAPKNESVLFQMIVVGKSKESISSSYGIS